MYKLFLATALLLALQSDGCGGGSASANKGCRRHSDHRIADPHHHNEFREQLGLPPTEWAKKVIAEEDEAYARCLESQAAQAASQEEKK